MVDAGTNCGSGRQFREVAQEPEPGHIGRSPGPKPDGAPSGIAVERCHHFGRSLYLLGSGAVAFDGC